MTAQRKKRAKAKRSAQVSPSPCSYLFLHGLQVPRRVPLASGLELLPADGISPDNLTTIADTAEDFAVLLLFLPRIASQFKITALDQKTLAINVWNAGWDALLLSAIFGFEVSQCIESRAPADSVTRKTWLRVTNHHLHGWRGKPRRISAKDCLWLEYYYVRARALISDEKFKNAVHCLSSHYWHPHPRPRLALLWAGIEGLFGIDSELSFRISIYAAKFLEPTDPTAASGLFKNVRQLYSSRSKAVHGGNIKGDTRQLIADSAALLNRLIRRCIELEALPNPDELLF